MTILTYLLASPRSLSLSGKKLGDQIVNGFFSLYRHSGFLMTVTVTMETRGARMPLDISFYV